MSEATPTPIAVPGPTLDFITRLQDRIHELEIALDTSRTCARPAGAVFYAAMAKAKALIPTLGKDRDVTVKSEKGSYGFSYSTMAAMDEATRKPLTDNGFSWTQFPTVNLKDSVIEVRTRIRHASGEYEEGHLALPFTDKNPQKLGAIISYTCRYALKAQLGLTSHEDTDLDDVAGPLPQGRPPETRPVARAAAPAQVGPGVVALGMALQSSKTLAELAAAAATCSKAKKTLSREDYESLLKVHATKKGELSTPTAGPTAPREPGQEG